MQWEWGWIKIPWNIDNVSAEFEDFYLGSAMRDMILFDKTHHYHSRALEVPLFDDPFHREVLVYKLRPCVVILLWQKSMPWSSCGDLIVVKVVWAEWVSFCLGC